MTARTNYRIIIVDDNPNIHIDFVKILTEQKLDARLALEEAALFGGEVVTVTAEGFEVTSAYQGQEAFELVRQAISQEAGFAMAFVDMRMPPGWDGVQTIEHLWEVDPDLQVVICTAYSDTSWEGILQKLGKTDQLLILKKPFDNAEVWQLARALTEKWHLARRAHLKLGELAAMVDERTAALTHTCEQLRQSEERSRSRLADLGAAQDRLAQIIDGSPVVTFVLDRDHRITNWNRACEVLTGVSATSALGTFEAWRFFYESNRPTMADLIVSGEAGDEVDRLYADKWRRSDIIDGAFEAEGFFPNFGEKGRWLYSTAAPLRDGSNQIVGAIETLRDITEQRQAELELRQQLDELAMLNAELKQTQNQLVQSEKLASIGQLAAGVAHEINNPIGFVQSNLGSLERYFGQIINLLEGYREGEALLGGLAESQEGGGAWLARMKQLNTETELDYLKEDIPDLLKESRDGIVRVKKIVTDLKDFSRVDSQQQWEWADLRTGLDSTLNIVNNQIKYRADVVKEYGELPQIKCLPSQLNQVFLNLLVNAAQAIPDGSHGTITLRCGTEATGVWVEISDTGAGIPEENLKRIFDPFFTTKAVGKGTGLGLSLSYGIVQKHGGRMEVKSEVWGGTTFRIALPIETPEASEDVS